MLEFEDFAGQRLAQRQNGAAAEVGKLNRFAHVFALFVVGVDFARLAQGDFLVLVGHLAVGHDHAVAIDFAVALVGVDDDIEVLVRTEQLGDHAAETLFEHAHHRGAVDVLGLFEFGKSFNQADALVLFSCHWNDRVF